MTDTQDMRLTGSERAEAILAEVRRFGFASIAALSESLGVSDMTIRRDVRRLAAGDELRLVHGGVSLRHGALDSATFAGRADQEAEAKRLIAEAAAELLTPTTTIAIDSGTTCAAVASALPQDFRGTVITHSIPVLQQMLLHPKAVALGLGGELLSESQVLIGPRTTASALELSVEVFFLGANSVDSRRRIPARPPGTSHQVRVHPTRFSGGAPRRRVKTDPYGSGEAGRPRRTVQHHHQRPVPRGPAGALRKELGVELVDVQARRSTRA